MAAREVLIPVLDALMRADDQFQTRRGTEVFDSVRTVLANVVACGSMSSLRQQAQKGSRLQTRT